MRRVVAPRRVHCKGRYTSYSRGEIAVTCRNRVVCGRLTRLGSRRETSGGFRVGGGSCPGLETRGRCSVFAVVVKMSS